MKAKAMWYQTDMHSLFLMQQTIQQQIPITPKKLFQAVRGNNGNADEGDGLLQAANPARGFLFIGKTSKYVVIKTT